MDGSWFRVLLALVTALALTLTYGGGVAASNQADSGTTIDQTIDDDSTTNTTGTIDQSIDRSDGDDMVERFLVILLDLLEQLLSGDGGGEPGLPVDSPAPCRQAAENLGFDPASFTNVEIGTEGSDLFFPTVRADLFCGFGGDDLVLDTPLLAGDLFIGGAGFDFVEELTGGTFDGGPDPDYVGSARGGVFNGGAGNDVVTVLDDGVFNGGAGLDTVITMNGGTFDGGDGFDIVTAYNGGTVFNTQSPPSGPRP